MKLPNKFLLGALALTLTAAPVSGSVDLTSLFNQVQNQQQQLNNHNVRISNNEQDIKKLQDDTSTQPAPDHAPVPDAPAPIIATSTDDSTATNTPTDPAPVAASTATTKTITKSWWSHQNTAGLNGDPGKDDWYCNYEYSDGTTSREAATPTTTSANGVSSVSAPTCKPAGTVVPN